MNTTTTPTDTMLTTPQAALRLSVSPRTLETWRLRRQGPAWVAIGRRAVRYRASAVERWIVGRTVDPAAPSNA